MAPSERSAVRSAGRTARRSLGGEQRRRAESQLVTHLQSLSVVVGLSSVGVFMAHDGEPDLQPLIDQLWQRGQTVVLPVLADDPADHTMRFVPWHHGEALVPGRYGIPVPPDRERPTVAPATLLVSLTAFDSDGGRMGRGGGFFDRYLATATSNVVGVGFEIQRVASVPLEPHDVQLPLVVTDLGVRIIT